MDSLSQIYIQKLKPYLVPILLVAVSFVIIMYIGLPQLNSIGEVNQQIVSKKALIEQDKKTQDALLSINDSTLSDDLKLAKRALPDSKDFVAIYSTLSTVALKSNVTITAFTINLGGIYSALNNSVKDETIIAGSPYLSIRLTADSSTYKSQVSFAENLVKALPLAEVKKLGISEIGGLYDISFYYKSIDTKQLLRQEQVSPLSVTERNNLQKISEWKD